MFPVASSVDESKKSGHGQSGFSGFGSFPRSDSTPFGSAGGGESIFGGVTGSSVFESSDHNKITPFGSAFRQPNDRSGAMPPLPTQQRFAFNFGSGSSGSSDRKNLNPFRSAHRQPTLSQQHSRPATNLGLSDCKDGGVAYKPTSINDLDWRGKKCVNKMISISGMPLYNLKSHEELRWQQHKGSKPPPPTTMTTFPPATVFKPFSSIINPFHSSANKESSSPVYCSSFSTLSTITPSSNSLLSPFISTPTKFSASSFHSPVLNPTPAGFNHTIQPVERTHPGGAFVGLSLTQLPKTKEDPSKSYLSAGFKDLNSPVIPLSPFTSTPTKFSASSFPSPVLNPTPAGFNYTTQLAERTHPGGAFSGLNFTQPSKKTEDPSRFDLSAGFKDLTGYGVNSPQQEQLVPDGNGNPFGVLPTMPRLSMHSSFNKLSSSPIGISSIPVRDTQAAPKISTYLSPRHLLQTRNKRFPVRKYDPKCDRPKVAFFTIDEGVTKTYLIPRENPRSLLTRTSSDD